MSVGIKNLIGWTFKRDVYGPSTWTDEIVEIDYSLRLVKEVELPSSMLLTDKFEMLKARKKSGEQFGYKVEVRVKSAEGNWYSLDEIVLYGKSDKKKHS